MTNTQCDLYLVLIFTPPHLDVLISTPLTCFTLLFVAFVIVKPRVRALVNVRAYHLFCFLSDRPNTDMPACLTATLQVFYARLFVRVACVRFMSHHVISGHVYGFRPARATCDKSIFNTICTSFSRPRTGTADDGHFSNRLLRLHAKELYVGHFTANVGCSHQKGIKKTKCTYAISLSSTGKVHRLESPRTNERHIGHPEVGPYCLAKSPSMYVLQEVVSQVTGFPLSRPGQHALHLHVLHQHENASLGWDPWALLHTCPTYYSSPLGLDPG